MDEQTELLQRCQEALGHAFTKPELLKSALTHSSVATHRLASNERLEFLGDSVLGLVVCEEIYTRFPHLDEGDLTKIKSIVVSRKTCAAMSRGLGLDQFIFLGKGMGTRRDLPTSLAAAVFEAVVAAYYLDAGFEKTRRWVLEQVRPQIDAVVADTHAKNFKSILQQFAQRELGGTPHYELLDEKGPDHSKCFEIGVVIGDRRFPSAWGTSKKEAEQKAALAALAELGAAHHPEIAAKIAEVRPGALDDRAVAAAAAATPAGPAGPADDDADDPELRSAFD
jgi:ribonuclease-3